MVLALPGLNLGLKLRGYRATCRWVERLYPAAAARPTTPADMRSAHHAATLAARASRHTPGNASCLRQALFVYGLLRRRGLNPRMQLGTRVTHSIPNMHAWVELDGIALGQGALEHQAFAASLTTRAPAP